MKPPSLFLFCWIGFLRKIKYTLKSQGSFLLHMSYDSYLYLESFHSRFIQSLLLISPLNRLTLRYCDSFVSLVGSHLANTPFLFLPLRTPSRCCYTSRRACQDEQGPTIIISQQSILWCSIIIQASWRFDSVLFLTSNRPKRIDIPGSKVSLLQRTVQLNMTSSSQTLVALFIFLSGKMTVYTA
jgi:hypothetical protein